MSTVKITKPSSAVGPTTTSPASGLKTKKTPSRERKRSSPSPVVRAIAVERRKAQLRGTLTKAAADRLRQKRGREPLNPVSAAIIQAKWDALAGAPSDRSGRKISPVPRRSAKSARTTSPAPRLLSSPYESSSSVSLGKWGGDLIDARIEDDQTDSPNKKARLVESGPSATRDMKPLRAGSTSKPASIVDSLKVSDDVDDILYRKRKAPSAVDEYTDRKVEPNGKKLRVEEPALTIACPKITSAVTPSVDEPVELLPLITSTPVSSASSSFVALDEFPSSKDTFTSDEESPLGYPEPAAFPTLSSFGSSYVGFGVSPAPVAFTGFGTSLSSFGLRQRKEPTAEARLGRVKDLLLEQMDFAANDEGMCEDTSDALYAIFQSLDVPHLVAPPVDVESHLAAMSNAYRHMIGAGTHGKPYEVFLMLVNSCLSPERQVVVTDASFV